MNIFITAPNFVATTGNSRVTGANFWARKPSTSNTMKIRRSILFLTAIAAVLLALLLWHGRRKSVEAPLATSTETNPAQPVSNESRPSVRPSATRTNTPAVNTATPPANVPRPSLGSKTEAMQGILSTYNDVPIDFYGKLVDQFGNPVAGAEIKGSIRVISGVRQSTDWLTTTSDASGLFQFHGRGQDISTMPSKEGVCSSVVKWRRELFYVGSRGRTSTSRPEQSSCD